MRKSEEEIRIHLSQPLWLYSEDVVAKNGDVHLFARRLRTRVSLRFRFDDVWIQRFHVESVEIDEESMERNHHQLPTHIQMIVTQYPRGWSAQGRPRTLGTANPVRR